MSTDQENYRRYLGGDNDGLTQIIIKYHGGLLRFLTTYVGNYDDAEDVLQDTFTRIAIKKPAFRPMRGEDDGFKAWLYVIARNEARQFLRKRRRQAEYLVSDSDVPVLAEIVDYRPGPEETVIREDEVRHLKDAMRSLEEEQYRVIYLRYFEDMQVRDIARTLGKSENYIYRVLEKARDILAKIREKGDDK